MMKFFTHPQTQTPLRIQHPCSKWLVLPLFCLVLLTQTPLAHADFRKALTAYQNRDGQTMLKEVQDAVVKKNDDGLVLFLSVLQLDKDITNRPFLSREEITDVPVLPLWQSLLGEIGINNLASTLEAYSTSKPPEIQYLVYQLFFPEKHRALMTKLEKRKYSLFVTPKEYLMMQAGDALLGENGMKKNETKGLRFLKQALSSEDYGLYTTPTLSRLSTFAERVSRYYLTKTGSNELRQAYLWFLLASSSKASSYNQQLLFQLQEKASIQSIPLSKIAPEISDYLPIQPRFNMSMNEAETKENFKKEKEINRAFNSIKDFELPEIVNAYQKPPNLKKQPVFTYYRSGNLPNGYSTNIYADGTVAFLMHGYDANHPPEKYKKISPEELKDFIRQLRDFGFEHQPLYTRENIQQGLLEDGENDRPERMEFAPVHYAITLRDEKLKRTILYSGHLRDLDNQFLAKVFKVTEELLPTQQYRCGTDKSRKFYQNCVIMDSKLLTIASKGETK